MALRHLLVDARPIDHPTARQRGIGRYVAGLLHGLHRAGVPLTALHGGGADAELAAALTPGLNLERWHPDVVARHAQPGTWYLATQLMLHPVPLDPIPSVITQARLPVAAVMYDVIPFRYPEVYLGDPNARRLAEVRAPLARTVDAVLAISEFAASTSVDQLGLDAGRTRVIGAGVDDRFRPPGADPWPRLTRLLGPSPRRFVLAVTGGDERKNTAGLLRAWGLLPAELRRDHLLVVAAAHDPTTLDRWRRSATEAGVADEVVFTGAVTDDEMVALMQAAQLAVMPSIEEGFGLPVLEAAACGVPAICSGVTSLPEVLAEPDAFFDPHQPASIAAAVTWALTDDDHRAVLLDAGRRAARRWTWEAVGRATAGALEELSPRGAALPRRVPRTMALLGPMEGSASAIGRYDVLVAEAIRRLPGGPELHVLVDGSASPEPACSKRFPHVERRHPARALGRFLPPGVFDDLVVVLGSSHHHVAGAQLALEHRAHLWLHEASLVGIHVGLAHLSGSRGWARRYLTERVLANEGAEGLAALGADALLDAERYHELGISLLGEHLDAARSVVVTSDHAAAVVRRLRPSGVPVLVLANAYPPVGPPADAAGRAEILAAGWLAANKLPELAVQALARLVAAPVAAGAEPPRLVFAGPVQAGAAVAVEAEAERLGVTAQVEITGALDPAAYGARVARARAGLQLRESRVGEQSAAVADLLAAGVPTVTTIDTMGPTSPGLQVVAPAVDAIVAALRPLLAEDESWRVASADAAARARRWTFDDVAGALVGWLGRVGELAPGAVERAGPR